MMPKILDSRRASPTLYLLLLYPLILLITNSCFDINEVHSSPESRPVDFQPSHNFDMQKFHHQNHSSTTSTSTTKKPQSKAITTKKPPGTTTNATTTTEGPSTTTEEPSTTTQEPSITTQGPSTTTTKPSTTTKKSSNKSTKSSSTITSTTKRADTTKKPSTTTTKPQLATTRAVKVVIQSNSSFVRPTVHFEARDITYFLESHPAHAVHDPRAYFTEERSSRSMVIMLKELDLLPKRMRFAYMVRIFNELGRKIVSKLNYYTAEVAAILRKTPDDLGNKPEVSSVVDTIKKAFESKEDQDPKEDSNSQGSFETPISPLINDDKEKSAVFNSSMNIISSKFADMVTYFVHKATQSAIIIPKDKVEPMATLLGQALQAGAKTFLSELAQADKFRVPDEVVGYASNIFNVTIDLFTKNLGRQIDTRLIEDVQRDYTEVGGKTFKDLNPMSDETGLIGPWNNYLFTSLGTSERVVKLFSSLLSRVPPEAKTRWINMYISQVYNELERTLSGFVVMQGMPHKTEPSEVFLLNPAQTVDIMPSKTPQMRTNYTADKNRIPARCYLAGRRWRMALMRGLNRYPSLQQVINGFADKIGQLKLNMVQQSGNEIYRLCMPRLEVGLRGWSINGEPQADGGQSSKFPMKNPLEGLSKMKDPFDCGALLGYKLGVKIGYNEERNATLEMESNGPSAEGQSVASKAKKEVEYLAHASYRRAATVAATKAFQVGLREGYMTTLKISVRSGIQIPSEAGSRMAALRCVNLAGQVGMEAGRSVADGFIAKKSDLSDAMKQSYMKVGEAHGLLAGQTMGQTIGAIVGKESAEEAYRRGIIRGGKVARAKFHLDEYEAGAKLGFQLGLKAGKQIAASPSLDPSAPKFFRLHMPVFSEADKVNNEVDHWEKDLIPPLTDKAIYQLHSIRGHTPVSGSMRGKYKLAKEIKNGLRRVDYKNETYTLDVFVNGFIMNNVAYLTLNGTVDRYGPLYGSLIARDIFNEDE